MITVSIICPVFNEERFIELCINSILMQDYPVEQTELILVDGMSTDSTRDLILPYVQRYSNIQILDNPKRTAPCAMNIGIRAAKGEFICRIDAHSSFPQNYISTLLKYINILPDASNVGAVCNTVASDSSLKAQAIAIACSHPFGVGGSTFRTTTVKSPTLVDTVPFGFWRKSLFNKIGLFDEEMTRNQDDEFNARTIQNGGKIYLVPDIYTTYFARDSIMKTAKMFYQYGLFKPVVNKKLKHPATLRQFVPLLFVLGLIIGFPLACINPVLSGIYIGFITLYLMIITAIGIKHKNLFLPIIFACMHISYGCGYIYGIIKVAFNLQFNAVVNR